MKNSVELISLIMKFKKLNIFKLPILKKDGVFVNLFKRNPKSIIIFITLILFTIVLIKTAWVSDDAYITFRTVDNFVNGYGLNWNINERVQTYTNTMWMFVISIAYYFTHEAYFTSILVSILISLAAIILFVSKIPQSLFSKITGVSILILSKAFTDFSTSGLENPLSHLIVVIFCIVYFYFQAGQRQLFY